MLYFNSFLDSCVYRIFSKTLSSRNDYCEFYSQNVRRTINKKTPSTVQINAFIESRSDRNTVKVLTSNLCIKYNSSSGQFN